MQPILVLTPAERTALEAIRDRAPHAYRRERAAALLKIAAGQPPTVVARTGLLKRRHPETVSHWLDAYRTHGLASLTQRPRRRGFSP